MSLLAPAFLLLGTLVGCATVGHSVQGIDNFDRVSPNLFRGAQPSAEGIRYLAAQNVYAVINLRDDPDPAEAALARDAGMTYLQLPWNAASVTTADAERFLDLLATVRQPVFVHCLQGRDRTGLAVAAYRLCRQQWTRDAALDDLYAHGHNGFIFPNIRQAIDSLALPTSASATVP